MAFTTGLRSASSAFWQYLTAPPVLTDGMVVPAQCDASGNLKTADASAAAVTLAFGTTADPAIATGLINTSAATGIALDKAQLIALQALLAAAIDTTPVAIRDDYAGEYETVAASQTAQVLGATGAGGDKIKRLIIIPATVAPGVVTLLDNSTSIPIWVGGTVGADLKPFAIDLDMVSVSGAWKVTTGANVSVIAVGNFT